MLPVITIQGPTAVGKSDFALKIIKKLDSELISADSRQIYKNMDLGTAKPSFEEQQIVPHHLLDIIEPNEAYAAGKFFADSRLIARQLFEKGKMPFLVGGTGFYVKTFSEGLFESPPINPEIRENVRQSQVDLGNDKLYKDLLTIDSNLEKLVHPNDTQRLLRHLEVFYSTGKTLPQHWDEQKKENDVQAFNILIVDDREELYQRINLRFDKMIKAGLLDEIESLIKKGYKENDPGMKTVGYQEFYPYFNKTASLEECLDKAKQHSRNYAKRQLTWYRKCKFDLVLERKSLNFLEVYNSIKHFTNRFNND